jgi:predicted DNA-binding transcriptional regulator YafY
LLSYGSSMKILKPARLVKRFREELEAMRKLYGGTP